MIPDVLSLQSPVHVAVTGEDIARTVLFRPNCDAYAMTYYLHTYKVSF
jgi:hypothetical protein